MQIGWTQSFPVSDVVGTVTTGGEVLGQLGHAITLTSGQSDTGNDFGNYYLQPGKRFLEPFVEVDGEWIPLEEWHAGNGNPDAQWFPLNMHIKWVVTYVIINETDDEWTGTVVRDRFGAELDIWGTEYTVTGTAVAGIWNDIPGELPVGNLNKDVTYLGGGVGFYHSPGKMQQLRFIWDIGPLGPGDIATLSFDVATKYNPGQGKKDPGEGKWEFTSCGIHVLNSGISLKWFVGDVQDSESSDPWAIQVCMPDPPEVTTELLSQSIILGDSVTDTAIVSGLEDVHAADGGLYPMPSGTVDFQVSTDMSNWDTYDSGVLLVDGIATSTSYMPMAAGTYYFKAVFTSDDPINCSDSESVEGDPDEELSVAAADSETTTTLSSSEITLGNNATDTATVTGLGGAFPDPTGTVDFQWSTDMSTWTTYHSGVPLAGSSATSQPYIPITAVTHYFRALFHSGDSNYNNSQSGDDEEPLTVID